MSYDVAITDGPVRAIFDLKGPQAALADWAGDTLPGLPDAPNRRVREDGKTLAHIGPDHWLLIADLTREEALTDALKLADAPPEISIVRVSDVYAWVRITGPDAAHVTATGCPLDLETFPEDGASFTEFFTQKALITRGGHGFEVAIDRSYAPWITEMLARITP